MNPFEKFRESCIFYIKIDFALLVGIFTLFTLLKVDPSEVPRVIREMELLLIAVVVLIVLDAVLERTILFFGTEAAEGEQKTKMKIARKALWTQTFLHVLVFTTFVSYGAGYLHGYLEAQDKYETQQNAYDFAKNAIDRFLDDNHKLPDSFDDVLAKYPSIKDHLSEYVKVPFTYILEDPTHYAIVLPGPDDKLGTADDWKRGVVIVYKSK